MPGYMPDNLADRKSDDARLTGGPSDRFPGILSRMPNVKRTTLKVSAAKGAGRKKPKKPPSALQIDLACRLRAIQAEMGNSDQAMADLVGAGRTTWTNWTNAENMPEEEAMVRLCDEAKVTMEWLYRGIPDGLHLGHAIRLVARTKGLDPDSATVDVLKGQDQGTGSRRG